MKQSKTHPTSPGCDAGELSQRESGGSRSGVPGQRLSTAYA
jgi:hypothetical protein